MPANDKNLQRRVLIVAGEASGDLHGSRLIREARDIDPGLSFFGIGGQKMAAAGCEIIFPAEEIAVMGLVEVVGRLPKIRRALRQVGAVLSGDSKPDLVLLIDFPGFNMRVAKLAKASGVPVLYYITPKVWAWKPGRAKILAQLADRLAVIFPFEPDYFLPWNRNVDYVGNPLLDEFALTTTSGKLRQRHGIPADSKVVGLFPGSRLSEIRHIFDALAGTARWLREREPDIEFLVPLAPSLDRDEIESRLAAAGITAHVTTDNIYDVSSACDAILAVSGTVTLQAAMVGTPMAVLYRGARLTYLVGKMLVKIPHFSLVNIVAGREIVREYLQDEANPANLGREIIQILQDHEYNQAIRNGLRDVREKLGEPGCSRRVAQITSAMTR